MVEMQFSRKELERFTKRVRYCARFGQKNAKELVAINKRVGKTYVKAARSAISDSKEDVKVYEKGDGTSPGKVKAVIKRGTLRRSMGTWKAKRGESLVLAGPRSGHIHRALAGSNRDGWHQFIVEGGHAGSSTSHNTKNKGVFQKTLSQTTSTMRMQQYSEYRKNFKRYMR
jgi:hypothetical protein